MKLFVGIDVSSEKLDTCYLTDEMVVLLNHTYGNDTQGAWELKEQVLAFYETYSFDQIVIGMESTSMYSYHPAVNFHQDEQLQAIHAITTIENPHRIKQYIKMFDEDKTDPIDAFMIADYLRIQRYTNSPIKEEKYMALQRLTRTRYQFVRQLVEVKQHFIENLSYKCNTLKKELREAEGSTTVFSAAIMELFTQDLSLDDLANLPLKDFAEWLQTKGRGRFKDPEGLAKTIQRAIRSSYRLDQVVSESVDMILGILVREIRSLEKAIKDCDQGIEDLVQTVPEYQCLTSIPGVGPVYAAGLLAEIGQIQRFPDQASLAKYAGLTWPRHQSGRHEAEDTPLTKKGNRYFRYYLIEAANSVRRHLPEYQAFYRKKYQETPKHQHKRAIVLTARKFVRLVDTLLRNHQLYTPPRSVIEK
ncbi:MAG: IS110 family transposase [Alkalibacterium sp.]|uniref:IS110 family transposase n=1 Tax=Tetragenococcus koreensis TaxID=290335 RepID=UPI000F506A66|nr:IS110 family transposase [Tetragenococcus koreensis]AYW45888.1 IS110 family transposase [Tetragenococcus koreensis]MCF1618435.1 IS110 family transposase [Tetragenococcus koreensis]MDN6289571.1 IS110 family transposase [Tetragenococcus koreensis]MDN6327186.1 IS110 family transposase [Alkalibacterium sp.]